MTVNESVKELIGGKLRVLTELCYDQSLCRSDREKTSDGVASDILQIPDIKKGLELVEEAKKGREWNLDSFVDDFEIIGLTSQKCGIPMHEWWEAIRDGRISNNDFLLA